MRANFEKFLFVGVMIVSTFFVSYQSRGDSVSPGAGIVSKVSATLTTGLNVPIDDAGKVNTLDGNAGAIDSKTSAPEFSTGDAGTEVLPMATETQPLADATDSLITAEKQTPLVADGKGVAQDNFSASSLSVNSNDGASIELSGGVPDAGFVVVNNVKPGEVQAAEALVTDLLTGESYFSLNADRRWPLASLTKLMTGAIAMKKNGLTKSVVMSEESFGFSDLSVSDLKAGYTFSVLDLLRKMLMSSSNEAAEAFAYDYGREKFLGEMNAQAAQWGMPNTNFKDPTGISVSNQSTASEIQKLVKRIYDEYPEIFKITRKSSINILEQNSNKKLKVTSNNEFAGRTDFLGGKTGYTDEARGNLVSIFSYGGRPVLIIVLGSEDRFGETGKLYDWFKLNYTYKH